MNILGINNFFEHPAVALISDGKLVFAMEEERITRIKHGKSYTPYKTFIPFHSIYAAFKTLNITFQDIDEVAFSYNKWKHLKGIWGCLIGRRLSSLKEELSAFWSAYNIWPALHSGYELPLRYANSFNLAEVKNKPFKEWDHHLSHAASAFYCSGFDKSLILVSDGSGENACTSVYLGTNNKIKLINKVELPNSLGFFYSFITKHLGFEPFSDEYKVMGMSAYGEDRYRAEMDALVYPLNNGLYQVDIKKLRALDTLFGKPRGYNAPIEQKHFDMANSAQKKLEEILGHLAHTYMKYTNMQNICLAGGTFLNILANSHIAQLSQVKNIFIQPASHDAGTAIGSAALSWVANGGTPQLLYDSMFLGTSYNNDEIEKILKLAGLDYVALDNEKLIQTIADLLAKENIIALFRGKMEFGPRSLGNRSLIASPKSARTRYKLNELKVREQFRPLAPIVPPENFSDFFEGQLCRYMMFTVRVREEMKNKIPAVVHNDGTARAQVIYKEHDEFLYKLLKAFEVKSGIPILINTSLNVRGKPIDESPQDALSSFFTSGIDYIVLGNFLVKNNNIKT